MNVRCLRAAAAAVFLAAAAALPAAAAPVVAFDPTGDTFNTGTIDITSTSVNATPVTTTFTLTFAGAVAAPSAFAPNSVLGFIDIDTDQKASTGGTAPWGGPVVGGNSWINFFIPPNPGTPSIPGPTVAIGDEFYFDLGSELFHPGLIDVVSTLTNLTVGVAPVIYAGTTVQIFVPTALMGNDLSFNYAVLVGDFLAPTDRAPNGAFALEVPEPASLLLALGALGALPLARRRRQAA